MDEQLSQEQNQLERQLSKKERRQMRREEKRREQEKAKKAKGRKNILLWAGLIVLAALGAFLFFRYLLATPKDGSLTADILKTCVNHTGVSMHIHPDLRIVINGEAQEIPANVGISGNCMRPLHTHDGTGKLHIEFPRTHNFTLGDFFHVWDKQFSSSKLFDYVADESNAITMTVNREPNTEYEKYVLKDHDQIEIRYGKKEAGEGL